MIEQEFTPVYLGTAYRNKGVQPLLDAIVRYLPSPLESPAKAKTRRIKKRSSSSQPDPTKPFVGMAFKIVEDEFGQLTFTRIYQGKIEKGGTYYNQRTGKKERFGRIVKMHADKREEIDSAEAGDIVAIMGIDCASGDTYCSEPNYLHARKHLRRQAGDQDVDHADVARQLGSAGQGLAAIPQGRPDVPGHDRRRDGRNRHRRHGRVASRDLRRANSPRVQGRGRGRRSEGQLPRIGHQAGRLRLQAQEANGRFRPVRTHRRPDEPDDRRRIGRRPKASCCSSTTIRGGRIPANFIPAIEKGFRNMFAKGPVAGFPVVGIKIELNDGSYHEVDSSDMAFMVCAQNCFRETFPKMKPVLLEPIMLMELELPENFQGAVVGNISSRRGIVMSTDMVGNMTKIIAEVPLAETFGYSTDLRSMTQGQGTFTMELCEVPPGAGEHPDGHHRRAKGRVAAGVT